MDTLASFDPAEPVATRRGRPVWTEAVWLERLETAVAVGQRAPSPIADALPAMLIALGWHGTARTLPALLPPLDEAVTFDHLKQLLATIGFRARCIPATGTADDTSRLRAGSLAQLKDGKIAVFLGHLDGKDTWLVDGSQCELSLARRDTIFTIEPDVHFQPVDEPRPKWFRRLFEHARGSLGAMFAISFVMNSLVLTVSLYTMVVYGVVIPSGATPTIWSITTLAVVAIVGCWALKIGRQVINSRLASWAGIRIGVATMRKLLALPLDISMKSGVQNNIVRMRTYENARTFLGSAGGPNLMDYPFVVIFLIAIAFMGGWLVFVPILSLLTYGTLALPTSEYVESKAASAGAAAGKLEEHAVAAFLGINAFYKAGGDSQWLAQFAGLAREAAARNREYAIAVARAQAIGQALGMVTVMATLVAGTLLVLSQSMSAAGLVAAMMLIWRITTPAQQMFTEMLRVRQAGASIEQLDALMAMPAERAGAEFTSPVGVEMAELVADRLYYRPDANFDAALNGVSFTVPAGSRVAVVGPNAAGKSALLECLAGLQRPHSGRVLIDGRDIRQFDATEYRAWVGYVPQTVPALPVTVRDYLRLRAPALPDAAALEAFQYVLGSDWRDLPVFAGEADKVLDRMLNPFTIDHTELQFRQIVAFVAATLGHPAVLLIDGDGVGGNLAWERRILRYLDLIRGSTTVIWAPYTMAHIQTCDEMVILERGSVLHAGPVARGQAEPPPVAPATQIEGEPVSI